MPISEYFATTYDKARSYFITAAKSKGAKIYSYELCGIKGPYNESLTTDVAIIGQEDAENVLLIISGTHGVEGFAGSGCQVGFLQDELFKSFSPKTLIILIHSLNPYGFAWLRRVNEDNVDLNRNFLNFKSELPLSHAYEDIHDLLIPLDWEGAVRLHADLKLQQYIKQHGLKSFQATIQRGQFSRPDGLFYGGVKETWSNSTLHQILKQHIPKTTKKLASIDIHTGLGPSGHGELIYIGSCEKNYDLCIQWFGDGVTSPTAGNAVAAKVLGTVTEVFSTLPSEIEVGSIALEFGTKPAMEVLEALRADHWLHLREHIKGEYLYSKIKEQLKSAFYEDTNQWKAAIYSKTLTTILKAVHKMSL